MLLSVHKKLCWTLKPLGFFRRMGVLLLLLFLAQNKSRSPEILSYCTNKLKQFLKNSNVCLVLAYALIVFTYSKHSSFHSHWMLCCCWHKKKQYRWYRSNIQKYLNVWIHIVLAFKSSCHHRNCSISLKISFKV